MTDSSMPAERPVEDRELAEGLVGERHKQEQIARRARTEGVGLVGPGGLLTGLTKTVLEASSGSRDD